MTGSARARWLTALVLLWAAITAVVRLSRDPLDILHDNAINLDCAGRILNGALPYRDFFDVGNPPLVMYWHAIPVSIAKVLNVSPIPVFTVGVIALAVWSTLSVQRLLARFRPELDSADIALVSMPLLVLTNDLIQPLGVFGQREDQFMLLYAPFLILRSERWRGGGNIRSSSAIGFGIAAAVGLSFKPYFALEAVALELAWLAARRRLAPLWSPEIQAVIAVAVLYAGALMAMPQVMRDGYFGHLIPLILRGYRQYDADWMTLISTLLRYAWPAAAAAAVLLGWTVGRWSKAADLILPATALGAAGLAAFVYQHKGWLYQLAVYRWSVVLLGCLAASGIRAALQAHQRWRRSAGPFAALALILLAAAATVPPKSPQAAPYRYPEFETIVQTHSQRGDAVLVLSTSVTPAYPALIQLGRRPASRFLWTFPIAMIAPWKPRTPELAEQESWFLTSLADDIRRDPPELVVIQSGGLCQACPEGFSVLSYFQANGFLDQALRNYSQVIVTNRYSAFARRAVTSELPQARLGPA